MSELHCLKSIGSPYYLFCTQINDVNYCFLIDKKVKDGKLTFILCNEIGNAVIKNDINVNVLQSFLKEIINE